MQAVEAEEAKQKARDAPEAQLKYKASILVLPIFHSGVPFRTISITLVVGGQIAFCRKWAMQNLMMQHRRWAREIFSNFLTHLENATTIWDH